MAGKGDKPRPTNLKIYGQNYDAIDWGIIWCDICRAHHKSKIKCRKNDKQNPCVTGTTIPV